MNRMILGATLSLALASCGGQSGDAEDGHEGGHGEHAGGEGGGDHHAGLPPEVHGFHEVLAPIWHAEEGDTRRDLACERESLHDLESAADDVEAMSVPEGVDENTWHAAADDLAASVDGVAGACEGGGAETEARLSDVHDAFHAVAELVAPPEPEAAADAADGSSDGATGTESETDAVEEPASETAGSEESE